MQAWEDREKLLRPWTQEGTSTKRGSTNGLESGTFNPVANAPEVESDLRSHVLTGTTKIPAAPGQALFQSFSEILRNTRR